MAVYRPSVVVNFALTFDESLLPNPNLPSPVNLDDTAVNPAIPTSVQPKPPILSTGSNVSFVMARIPKSLTLEMPGYRQAATFQMTIDWKDMPIDPRAIRAAAVEIHMGTVSDLDFAYGVRQQMVNAQNPRRSILKVNNFGANANASTLKFTGTADEWDVTHDTEGSVISIRGRDMRGLLIDTPLGIDPVRANKLLSSIDLGEPIDRVVAHILALYPTGGNWTVQVNPSEWPDGVIPSPDDSAIIPRGRQGAKGKRKAARPSLPSGIEKITFWDLIVKFCYLCGAIPYFKGTSLIIRPSRSIFDQQRAAFDPRFAAPFEGDKPRTIDAQTGQPLPEPISVRKLLYGRDVKSMSFNRKFGGYQKPKVVRVVGINPDASGRGEQFISATWPPSGPTARLTTKMAPSGSQSEEEILNIPVHGITDIQRLQEIARSVFEEVGRGEMGGAAESPNIASFGGDNNDPDLLWLSPGDGVFLDINIAALRANNPLVATLIDTMRTPYSEQVQTVADQIGGDVNLANAIVATARGQVGQLQRFFRVSTVRYNWGVNQMQVSFDFQNYVVARNQIGETQPADPGQVKATSSSSRAPVKSTPVVKPTAPPFNGKFTDTQLHDLRAAGYTDAQIARLAGGMK